MSEGLQRVYSQIIPFEDQSILTNSYFTVIYTSYGYRPAMVLKLVVREGYGCLYFCFVYNLLS